MEGVGSTSAPVAIMFRVFLFKGKNNPTTILFR